MISLNSTCNYSYRRQSTRSARAFRQQPEHSSCSDYRAGQPGRIAIYRNLAQSTAGPRNSCDRAAAGAFGGGRADQVGGTVFAIRPSMLASLRSAAVFGVEAFPVQIEVDVSFGLPRFTMVGLPDATVRESRDRVRSAIRNSGFEFPSHRITVNLAPADVRKAGSSFDLPIALGLLATSGALDAPRHRRHRRPGRTVARRRHQRHSGRAADCRRHPPSRAAPAAATASERGRSIRRRAGSTCAWRVRCRRR